MTLHWWMHWFWITKPAVLLLTLLLVSPTLAAPAQIKANEELDSSPITEWSPHHGEEPSADHWIGTQDSATTSIKESSISSVLPWPSGSTIAISNVHGKAIVDPYSKVMAETSTTTYLPVGTDLNGDITPFLFGSVPHSASDDTFIHATEELLFPQILSVYDQTGDKQSVVSDTKDNVPVGSENQKYSESEGTVESYTGKADEDNSSVVLTTENVKLLTLNNLQSTVSNSSNISPNSMLGTLNSNSQGMDKPSVNLPRLITRDLKNGSESLKNNASLPIIASHLHDQVHAEETSPRTGKVASFHQPPFVLHPLILSTVSPSKEVAAAIPFPPNIDDVHDFMPKSSEEFLNPRNSDAAIKDSSVTDNGEGDSRITWVNKSPDSGVAHEKTLVKGSNASLDDAEMRDSPYNPVESSTTSDSKQRPAGDSASKTLPIPSSDLVQPTEKAADETEVKPDSEDSRGRSKVIPAMMTSSKVVNASSQSGRLPDNGNKSNHTPPTVLENSEVNTSVGNADDDGESSTDANSADLPVDTKSDVLAAPSSAPSVKGATNVTRAPESIETTTGTVLPTVVPVSNGRVAAAAAPPAGSHHGLDAASITGISLGILVFAALVGAVSFVLYRRRFLNKPQTLNDKCSNPDSSGYIDDSTLRENSEEMYSLDNDSFLNSLEAMTIQNYWTDNVKHTKL